MKDSIRHIDHTTGSILSELAEILALGLQRLNARKSSRISPANRDSPLDFTPESHGHVQREREDIGT
ncbi:hypothetical protein [Tardiphaga sp.]|uniref:hypothetical protein n=1 Tax=Tardiphaga sp. TaxID=1926292 RepID=UPI0026370E4C|nr:hypothetical protein [Tardiphaga sp.]